MPTGSVVLPICCFGNVFYYQQYIRFDQVLFDPWENYPKQTYRNRYEILNHNGKQGLTIPVIGQKGEKIPFNEIEIDYRENWPVIHWRSIVSAYQRSPYFEFYKDELEDFFTDPPKLLMDFNLKSHLLILEWLSMEPKEQISKKFIENPGESVDLRKSFKPSKLNQKITEYIQVFDDRNGFTQNLSILDLIFNLGPQSQEYLTSL